MTERDDSGHRPAARRPARHRRRRSPPWGAALCALATLAVPAGAPADPTPPGSPGADAPAAAASASGDLAYETVVSGLRLTRPLADTPPVTTVLPREEIVRAPVTTPDDLVRSIPSVAVFRRSSSLAADPSSQSLSLRGVAPTAVSRALVLQDGVPVNDPFGGAVYWRSLPLIGVERIEVVPSGASALYGNLALGGVAQVLSRPILGNGVEAEAGAGSFGSGQAALRITGAGRAVRGELLGSFLTSDGYRPIAPYARGPVDGRAPSDDQNVSARLEARVTPTLGVRGFGRFFHESLDAGTRFTSAAARAGTYGAGARLDLGDGGALDAAVFAGNRRFEQQRARVSPGRATASLAFTQHVPSDHQGGSLTWTLPRLRAAGDHVLLLGVDLQRVAGDSTEDQSLASPAATSIARRSAGGEQRSVGVFAQDAARLWRRVEASAAVRLDGFWNLDGSTTTTRFDGATTRVEHRDRSDVQLSPRAGLLVHLTDAVALRGSAYRSFRAPTLDELYRPFQVGTILTDANAALRAETLWGGEAGLEAVGRGLLARATGFWNRLEHPVYNVTLASPLPDGATRQRQNLGEARIRGVELEAGWRPGARFGALVAYTYVEPVVTSAPGHDELVGKDFPQDARHRGAVSLTCDLRRVAATAELRVIGPQYEDDRNTLRMGGFAVVNLGAAVVLAPWVALFARAENLFDRTYLVGRAGVDTVGQPRTLMFGLRARAGR